MVAAVFGIYGYEDGCAVAADAAAATSYRLSTMNSVVSALLRALSGVHIAPCAQHSLHGIAFYIVGEK